MSGAWWVYGADGQTYGPVDAAAAAEWARSGHISAETWVCPTDGEAWAPAGTVPDLARLWVAEAEPPASPAKPKAASALPDITLKTIGGKSPGAGGLEATISPVRREIIVTRSGIFGRKKKPEVWAKFSELESLQACKFNAGAAAKRAAMGAMFGALGSALLAPAFASATSTGYYLLRLKKKDGKSVFVHEVHVNDAGARKAFVETCERVSNATGLWLDRKIESLDGSKEEAL